MVERRTIVSMIAALVLAGAMVGTGVPKSARPPDESVNSSELAGTAPQSRQELPAGTENVAVPGSALPCARQCCRKMRYSSVSIFPYLSISNFDQPTFRRHGYYQEASREGAVHHDALQRPGLKWIRIPYRCWKDRIPMTNTCSQRDAT